jgi:hypothetical protein
MSFHPYFNAYDTSPKEMEKDLTTLNTHGKPVTNTNVGSPSNPSKSVDDDSVDSVLSREFGMGMKIGVAVSETSSEASGIPETA